MKRTVFIVTVVSLCVAAPSMGQGTVVGSKHDMSSQLPTSDRVCVFCHTPHQPTGVTTDPLWNHTLSSAGPYGVYASVTLNALPREITGSDSTSELCMSCHDGTVGLGSLYNNPNISGGEETPGNVGVMITGNPNLGTDLTNDHPVNFTYDTSLVNEDGELEAVASLPNYALIGGRVQCSSCHDPHDDNFLPFLNATNAQSALCLECHLK